MLIVLDRLRISERLAGRVDLFDMSNHLFEERGIFGGMVDGLQQLLGLPSARSSRVPSKYPQAKS